MTPFALVMLFSARADAQPCGVAGLRDHASCPRACLQDDWLGRYLAHPGQEHDLARTLTEQLTTPGQVPPELGELVERPAPCQLCVFQRDGSAWDILRRGIGGDDVPNEEVSFGHCFTCVQCPGAWFPTCRGWWPADPDGGDYEGDEGRIYDDMDEEWGMVSCASLSREEAARVERAMETYEETHTYQVTNNDGARSCTGFCTDIADVAGLRWFSWMGDYTIPGDIRFYGEYKAENPDQELPYTFMNRLVEGF